MAVATSTRALKGRLDNPKLIRVLVLVRIGVTAGIGAVIAEIADGEPSLKHALR